MIKRKMETNEREGDGFGFNQVKSEQSKRKYYN